MVSISNVNGCKVVFRDVESGVTIAETRIVQCDTIASTIWVPASSFDKLRHRRVSVLIFLTDMVYEYLGVVRASIENTIEISLYHGKSREGRKAPRYNISTPATVQTLWISQQLFTLRKPMELLTRNISSGGILISGCVNSLFLNSAFFLNLKLEDQDSTFFCYVVRMVQVTPGLVEYGCKFLPRDESEVSTDGTK